eukprot:m51a1_g14375 putative leucine rich repeat protein (807) ;mRNA; f:266526-270914
MGYDTNVCGVLALSLLPSVGDPEAAIGAAFCALDQLSQRRMICTDVGAREGDWDAILGELATPSDWHDQPQGSLLCLDNNVAPLMQPSLNCDVHMQFSPLGGSRSQFLYIESGRPYHCWAWLQYVINRVLEPLGVVANGQFVYQGEWLKDRGRVVVRDNVVTCLGTAVESYAGTTALEQVLAARQLASLFDIPRSVLPAPAEASAPAPMGGGGEAIGQLPDAVLWVIFERVGCTHSASGASVRLAGVCTAWRRAVQRHTRVYRLLDVLAPRRRSALLAALPRVPAEAEAAEVDDLGLPRFPEVHVVDLGSVWLLPHQTTLLVRSVMRALSPAAALAEVVLDGTALQRQTLEALLVPGQQPHRAISLSLEGCGGLVSEGVPEWLGEHVVAGDIEGLRVSPHDRAGRRWIRDHPIFGSISLQPPDCLSMRNATRMGECSSLRQVAANVMGEEVPMNFLKVPHPTIEELREFFMQNRSGDDVPFRVRFYKRFWENAWREKRDEDAILGVLGHPVCSSLVSLDLGCIAVSISQLETQLDLKHTGLRSLRLLGCGPSICHVLDLLPASLESLALTWALKVYSEVPVPVSEMVRVLRSLNKSIVSTLWIDGILAKDKDEEATSVAGMIQPLGNLEELHLTAWPYTEPKYPDHQAHELEQLHVVLGMGVALGWSRNTGVLTVLPPEIGTLTNLTELKVDDNELTVLLPEIGALTNLTQLKVNDNKLTELPPEIGTLTNLTQLNVKYNELTVLPPEIGTLTNLTGLVVNYNQLTALPPEIGTLTNLSDLWVNYNELTALPPEIGTLANLTRLVG